MRLLISIIVCLLCSGLAFASAEWPNEPAGSQMLLDCPFSGNKCNLQGDPPAFATDANAPLSGPTVLDNYLAAGASHGNGHWWLSLNMARELYVGAWWKTNPEFQGMFNSANKLMVFTGWSQGYLMWNGLPDQPRTILMQIATKLDNCHVSGLGVSDCPWTGSGTFTLPPNQGAKSTFPAGDGWHRLEVYQKASTGPTSRDGIMRWWVDGALVGDYRNLNYVPNGFEQFTLTHTWDGGPSCATRDCSRSWHHYWDHMRISKPNGAIDPVLPLAITSPLQTTAQVGKPYSATLQAANGKAPYGWTISSGSLLPGLTLNKTTGVISGMPTTCGRSDFTVKVMDSNVPPKEAAKSFTIIASGCTGLQEEKQLSLAGAPLSVDPKRGSVKFRTVQKGAYSLGVYDLSGRKMWSHSGKGEALWNHGGKLEKGVYVVRLVQGKETMKTVFCNIK